MNRSGLGALATLLLMAANGPSAAGEPVVARNDRFDAQVSATGQNRISILGDKIHSAHGLSEPNGPRTTAEVDEATGDLYLSFEGPAVGKVFSIFLTTVSGRTYQAVLTAQGVEAQTVLVRGDPLRQTAAHAPAPEAAPEAALEANPATDPAAAPDAAPQSAAIAHHEGYTELLVAFIRLMFNDLDPEGGSRTRTTERPRPAGPFLEQEITRFVVPGLIGHVLSVRNVSSGVQSLDSRRFLLPGVLAVTVSHETVAPGAYARIYVVEAAP